MKPIYKTIFSIFLTGMFLLFAFGSGESDEKVKIDINDQQALEKYIQGKWSWEKHTGDINHTFRYRFEIIGNKLRIWSCFNNTDDPFDMSEGFEEYNFTLGKPKRDIDGFHARYLEFGVFDNRNDYSLTFYSLGSFWLVSDENWDTPVLKCGSGISWSREEFQSTGKLINHDDSNLNKEETNTESDYSYSDSNNDENYPNEPMDDGYNGEENNSISAQNENNKSETPKFKIFNFEYQLEYSVAEAQCAKKNMRLPSYEELVEIANSSELLKNLKPYDKGESYWTSTEFKDGQNFSFKEMKSGDEPKIFRKNYNPFTEKTIMTDIRMSKNCICIE